MSDCTIDFASIENGEKRFEDELNEITIKPKNVWINFWGIKHFNQIELKILRLIINKFNDSKILLQNVDKNITESMKFILESSENTRILEK